MRWIWITAIAASLVATPAVSAECLVWAVEHAGEAPEIRERVHVSSSYPGSDEAILIASHLAISRGMTDGVDLVEVYVSRASDGIGSLERSEALSIAYVRYGAGDLPGSEHVFEGWVLADIEDLVVSDDELVKADNTPADVIDLSSGELIMFTGDETADLKGICRSQ